ncbi:uncharacterized protein K452DRAFT_317636 [Aplosporella prunicola CBS 121167]|uniref:NAD(P)-binding protein n=1 Tax=Aplosporella prunicola CBS 121167 TaxID=1176127 RepID=A0A6A6BLT3_9PEZI|nr:uncharacterized protein K452DRAFT_317636 [Aplosporella prunicola CBS 121167]KAF2143511.1 hypothetical protein K452DRAFT_317636 [Aplosporella prunicola CBS 121167]
MSSTNPNNVVYLITGANRGIGRAFVEAYLSRPSTTVVAGVRDPAHATAQSLSQLSKGASSELIVERIDASDDSSAPAAMEQLARKHGIVKLDVVIANAGVSRSYPRVAEVAIDELDYHVRINGYGTLRLFQATLPAMDRAASPKFVAVSSSASSIGGMDLQPFPNAAYGPSKALLNYLTRKMHFEHENIIVFPVDPGWVKTDMSNDAAAILGLAEAEMTPKESVDGLVRVIDGASREETSGRFLLYTGEASQW